MYLLNNDGQINSFETSEFPPETCGNDEDSLHASFQRRACPSEGRGGYPGAFDALPAPNEKLRENHLTLKVSYGKSRHWHFAETRKICNRKLQ
jgi:hypothetical protein